MTSTTRSDTQRGGRFDPVGLLSANCHYIADPLQAGGEYFLTITEELNPRHRCAAGDPQKGSRMTTEERIEAIYCHIVGSLDKPGLNGTIDALSQRVYGLERQARTSWLRERGTKALDALILGTVVTLVLLILSAGTKAVLRDAVSIQVSSRQTRKPPIPMPAGWVDEER